VAKYKKKFILQLSPTFTFLLKGILPNDRQCTDIERLMMDDCYEGRCFVTTLALFAFLLGLGWKTGLYSHWHGPITSSLWCVVDHWKRCPVEQPFLPELLLPKQTLWVRCFAWTFNMGVWEGRQKILEGDQIYSMI